MNRFERWSVWLSSLGTVVTGVAYLWMKYGLATSDPWSVVNHPWQPLVLKLHILFAPLLVFALGVIALRHVWRHLRNGVRWGRVSGIALVVSAALMIATGYLIQAVTHRGWLRAMIVAHVGFGLVYLVGLAAHQVAIRRGLARNGAAAGTAEAAPPPARVGRVEAGAARGMQGDGGR